jgi:hypothetical protein
MRVAGMGMKKGENTIRVAGPRIYELIVKEQYQYEKGQSKTRIDNHVT